MFDGEPILTNGSDRGHRLPVMVHVHALLENISAILINIHVQMYINKRPNGLNGHFSIIYTRRIHYREKIYNYRLGNKRGKEILGTVQCSVYYLMGHDTKINYMCKGTSWIHHLH